MRPCASPCGISWCMMPLPGGHPLHVAGAERAAVAQAVAVLDGAGEHVGDGLDAAVRMPRKAGEVVVGPVVAEIVEQQERIEFVVSPKPKARRSLTPAPSMVGCDCTMRLTGRMDMDGSAFRWAASRTVRPKLSAAENREAGTQARLPFTYIYLFI